MKRRDIRNRGPPSTDPRAGLAIDRSIEIDKRGYEMSDNSYKQGQSDRAAGKGQRDPNSFSNDKERKDYQAGWKNEDQKKR